jgi:hypothetical protein
MALKKKIRRYPNVTLIQSKKGRAIQMNVGAKAATKFLYFLHCGLPPRHFDHYR